MLQHSVYWRATAKKGITLIIGPVLCPKGACSLGIIKVDGEDPVQTLATEDPAVKSGLGRMEIYSMLAVLGR
jgi:uncharacterized protein YciI